MSKAKEILNSGDLNTLGAAAKAIGLGSIVLGENGYRQVGEIVPVASASATTTYKVKKLLYARTIGTGAPAEKTTSAIAGTAPSAGTAAPAADGLTVAFHAETTGTGTAELIYVTTDPVEIDGIARTGMDVDIKGVTA